jgi:flagellar biosynthesis anti-sigma factor FlgM
MRIDPNQVAPSLPENNRNSSQATASQRPASVGSSLGQDQAQLSGIHGQVQALAAQAALFPEIRQENVNALRQAVLDGSYQRSSEQVAGALFEHIVTSAAA